MTNRLQPAYQAGIKGAKGTSTKALKRLSDKDYKIYRGEPVVANIVYVLSGIFASPSGEPVIANIVYVLSGIFASLSKDGWIQPVRGCTPKGVAQ
jgi:hypothetical protein